ICRPAAFQFSCQTIQRRTCNMAGDPHCYTFDNQVFHFQGTCTYVLSEQCGSALPYYRVEGKNEHRGSTRVSWVRLVKVFVYDEVIELVKGHRGKPGCDVRCGGLDCSGCTAEQTALYSTTLFCGIIQSSSGPFAACHQQHPPERFEESCVHDLCVGGGSQPLLCQAIEPYASLCQQNGVQVSWRRPGFCEIPCPANSHFESQGTGCPPTCVNPNSTDDCPFPGQESCVCNAGYVLSAGVCIPHAECGCSFEGRYYSSGETVILGEDCGTRCSCRYGSMTCSSHLCGPHESCSVEEGERGCRPNGFLLSVNKSWQIVIYFMLIGADIITFLLFCLQVNGDFVSTPISLNNGTVQVYQSGFFVVINTDFGLEVSYDTNHHVRISVPLDYRNSTCGLCGNFNNRPEDDFRTRQGAIVSSDVDFANSWRASGDDEPSCDVRCGGLDCSGCTAEQTELYSTTAHCGIIQSSSGPFAACHQQHPPQRFVESCVYDLCVGGGYQPFLCQAIEAYASQCQQNGVQVSWRRPGFCEIPCPANSHFESQGTGCPPTCVNPNFTEDCPLPARESCVCNAGYVLSAGVCVPHAECGCSFEGRYYSSGETVILGEDCGRRCSCSYGSMTCSSHACGPHESCSVEEGERGCRPNSYATCWIREGCQCDDGFVLNGNQCVPPTSCGCYHQGRYRSCGPQESCRVVEGVFGCHPKPHGTCYASGDPHYKTFDGMKYDFQGTCRYILAKDCNATGRVTIFVSGSRTFVNADFGLSVTFDGRSTVFITLPSDFRYFLNSNALISTTSNLKWLKTFHAFC
uniref:VWFD domain-containing protein n=1 Tax=Salarias fasciatus TaxID=181472 RepID=A0A672F6G2_SALFA